MAQFVLDDNNLHPPSFSDIFLPLQNKITTPLCPQIKQQALTSQMRFVHTSGAGSGSGPIFWWRVAPVVPFCHPGLGPRASRWWVTASVTPKVGTPQNRSRKGPNSPKPPPTAPRGAPPGSNMLWDPKNPATHLLLPVRPRFGRI